MVWLVVSSLGMLMVGGVLVIWQAGQEVEKEVDSSVRLAVQLMGIAIADGADLQGFDDLSRIHALSQTRHLRILLQKADGRIVDIAGDTGNIATGDTPPAWFVHLVGSHAPQVARQLKTGNGELVRLIVQAQPLDEITEVWQESRSFFVFILILVSTSFLVINLVFNRALSSIATIVQALQDVEAGHYQRRLPAFAVAEFDKIARALNHLMAELDRAGQENRALTQHSLAIQEDERRKLSRELHDELGQSLTAIKVMAVTAGQRRRDVSRITHDIAAICDHLMRVVRGMMQQLHPLVLSELGLKAALEELAGHWTERHPGLQCLVNCDDAVEDLNKDVAIQLFRVIQESLTNVVRHAQASCVRIDLTLTAETPAVLTLRIRDDGRGCELRNLSQGFGLLGIRERIGSLGGEIEFSASPGEGMTLNATLPV